VYQVSEKNLSTLQSLAEAQARQQAAVEAQLKAGAADRLDLLSAQLEFGVAELVRLDSQLKLDQALGALEDAVQRPVDLPEGLLQSQRTHAP
jgi:outer membrane protein TolC